MLKHTIRLPFGVSITFLTRDCSKVQHYSLIEAAKAAYSNEAKVGELCRAIAFSHLQMAQHQEGDQEGDQEDDDCDPGEYVPAADGSRAGRDARRDKT